MIKEDITQYLREMHGGIGQAEAHDITELILERMRQSLARGEDVTITNFGRFRIKQISSRTIILPDGKLKNTEGGRRVQFLPGPSLKKRVNSAMVDDREA